MTEETAMALWEVAQQVGPSSFVKDLRERGLIAPEPVDALLIEAREIAADFSPLVRLRVLEGDYDGGDYVRISYRALKRGMELAQPPLTRADVRRAFLDADMINLVSNEEMDRLHAALTERQP